MKKATVILLLLISAKVFSEGMIEKQGEVKFRNFHWGTSIKEFIAKEGRPDDRTMVDETTQMKMLTYEDAELSGYSAEMYVCFIPSGLCAGIYTIQCKDEVDLDSTFRDLSSKLTILYGITLIDRDFIEEYMTAWLYTGGYIILLASDDEMTIALMYISPDAAKLDKNLYGL
ncbi:hypothetical protein K7I13_02180 [Brucepastera parasyntrophica]|uniref:hypothetical protein n=1 Tax=Brucepastera parasyntrophica TaxID=2880008 RepID=UPI00210BFD51|nr:hypothetical protein [Brucepastera parasyntrophica]ULQ60152.1 hypothetical protein K7I13_02180 [Brucepastera parasyntrophica]